MIRYSLIVEAAGLSAAVVALAAALARWRPGPLAAAEVGTFAVLVLWRAISNAASLNGDFSAYVSVGDSGCLVAGAIAPMLVATQVGVPRWARVLPAVAGGVAGFLINVVIL